MLSVALLYAGSIFGDILLFIGTLAWMENSETASAFDYDRGSRRKGRLPGKLLALAGFACSSASITLLILNKFGFGDFYSCPLVFIRGKIPWRAVQFCAP